MKKSILSVILLMLSTPLLAVEEGFSVKGLNLGIGFDSIKSEGNTKCYKDADNATTEVCKTRVREDSKYATLAGNKVSYILAHMHNDQIVRLYFATKLGFSEDYKIIVEAFTGKYGKPKELSLKSDPGYGWRISELSTGHQLNGSSHYEKKNQLVWNKGDQALVLGGIIPSNSTYDYGVGNRPNFYPYAPRQTMSSSDLIKPRGGLLLVDSKKYRTAVKTYSKEVKAFKEKQAADKAAAKKAKVANDL